MSVLEKRPLAAAPLASGSKLAPSASQLPPAGGVTAGAEIGDIRFRTLLGETAWAQLPEAVQRRFSKRLALGDTIIYRGEVLTTELSPVGRVLSFLGRAIGAPLPLTDGATGPALVLVSEDAELGGQCWLRIYTRAGKFPQAIHSAKRFRGPTGLEEYVGSGIGMALQVSVEAGALVFRSAGYFLALGDRRLPLPGFLCPGQMRIEHRDLGDGSFAFTLELVHRLMGRLVHQLAHFRDA
ncbi:MAG: DUF4166 domain-containing protein [Hyphomicrobium sp.]|jgi:hypothetical protein